MKLKIKDMSDWGGTKFSNLKICSVFKSEGQYYLKVVPTYDAQHELITAVRLSDGHLYFFGVDDYVLPLEGELVIKRSMK